LDLQVTKIVDDATPDEGQIVTYTVTVTNNGPAQATSVSLDDVLPAGLTVGIVTPSAGTSWSAPTWTVGTMNNGASATLNVQATVNAGTAGSTITNTVTGVSLGQTDSNATADTLSAPVTVSGDLDLQVTKIVDDATPDESQAMPAGLTVGTVTPSAGTSWSAPTWTIGTLNSGSSATLDIQATVNAGTAGSTITNTVTNVSLGQTDTDATADTLSAPVTVNSDLDLHVAKTVDDATPDEGQTINYTVTVTNNGPAQATSVSLDDVLPAGLTVGSVTPSAGTSWSAPTWTIGTLDSGTSATLGIQVTVDAGTSGSTITNTVTNVSLGQTDSNATADTLGAPITVNGDLDLQVTKTVDDATPDEGQTINYTVTVTNNGPAQATSVSLDDVLPAGLTVGIVTPSVGTNWSAPTWTIGTLNNGASATLDIQASVDAGSSGSTITNTVTNVSLGQTDIDATADTLSAPVTVNSDLDLHVAKTVDDPTPGEGDSVTYTITVTNNGPIQATNVNLDDVFPAGVTTGPILVGGGSWAAPTWTIGTLDAGASATLVVDATVDAGTSGSTITNTVTNVTLDQTDSDATADTLSADISVRGASDLSLSMVVDETTPIIGSDVTFTYTVSNAGPDVATGVTVQEALPSGYTLQSASGSGSYDSGTGIWTLPNIAVGGSRSRDFQATVESSGIYLNTAEILTSDTTDPDSTPGNGFGAGEDDEASQSVSPTPGSASCNVFADQDSWLKEAAPSESHGSDPKLANHGSSGDQQRSVVRFDLSSFPPGSSIASAVLLMSVRDSESAPQPITIHRITDAWVEGGVNWSNTAVDFDATVYGSILPDATDPVAEDLTTLVEEWVGGTHANHGVMFLSSNPGDLVEFASREYSNSSDRPCMIVSGVAPPPVDLHVDKSVDDATPDEGDTIVYTITVSNNGPGQATNVSLDDVLPAGLTIGTVTPSGSTSWSEPTWTIGILNDTESVTLLIQATVDAGASSLAQPITNAVSNLQVDQTDSDATADTLSVPITVGSDLDLRVAKTVDDATPDEGQTIAYTVTVTNSGPAQATNVSLDDVLPAGLTVGTVTPSAGTSWSAPTWTVGALSSGASATLSIAATVDPETSGQTITNTVTNISLDQTDSDATADTLAAPVTVNSDLDLNVVKTVDDPTPDEGQTVTYTVTVTNNGPAQATNVSLDDVLPTGLTAGTVTPSAGTSWSAPTWMIGTLVNGASATLDIQVTIDAGTSGSTITNTVTNVSLSQTDTDATADTPSAPVTVNGELDLHVAKTVDDATPDEGQTVNYTVTVTNNGPAQATSVSLDDTLPAGLTVGTVTPSAGTSWSSPTWTIGTLSNGSSATLDIQATVDVGTAGTTITNTVTNVALDQTDSDATADTPSAPISVASDLDLHVSKIVDDATPDEGQTVNYTVTVTNNGPAQATSVSLDDVLPAGLTVGAVTPSAGTNWSAPTWTIGTLNSGASASLGIQVTVNAGTAGSTITNTVTNVSLSQADSNATVDTPSAPITVGADVDLHVAKIVDDTTPDEGQIVNYTVTVTNNGPAQATSVSLHDVLPAGLTVGTVTPGAGTSWSAPTWTIGTLNSGASATLGIQATVDAGTAGSTITNTVTNVSLSQTDSNATADTLSAAVTVGSNLDLHVVKTVDDATPNEGQTVNYTVTVTNIGPAQATSVSLDDVLPAGLTVGTVTPGAGTSWSAPTWTIGTLDSGASTTLGIQATVDVGTAGTTITNTVTNVALDQTDSDATADTPSAPISVASDLDLHVSKIVDDATPNEGQTVNYTVTVTNNGPAQATSVSLDDMLPAGLTPGTVTPSAGTSWSAPTWTIGTLSNGSSATLDIQATVDVGTAGSTITNTITGVVLDQTDSNATGDSLSVDITVPTPTADLSLTKTVDIATPTIGNTVSFTLSVANAGPSSASGVTVLDLLPTGYTYVGHLAGAGVYDSGTGVWSVGSVLAGESATLVISATVDITGDYINVAEITAANEPDPDSIPGNGTGNGEDDEAARDTTPVGTDGTVDITDSGMPGDTLTIVVDDADLDIDPGSAETIQVIVVHDATGESETTTLTETGVSTGVFQGTVGTTFGATAGTDNDGVLSTQAGDTLTVTYLDEQNTNPAKAVEQRTDQTSIFGGDDALLTITSTSAPGDTLTLAITDADPDNDPGSPQSVQVTVVNTMTGESETLSLTETGVSTGVFQGTLGTAAGASAGPDDDGSLVTRIGDILNASYLDTPDGRGGASTVNAGSVVGALDAVAMSKSASKSEVIVGDTLTYLLGAENTTGGMLSGIILSDRPPLGFKYVQDSAVLIQGGLPPQSITPSALRPLEFGPFDLAAGEAIEVRYVMRVGSGAVFGEHENRVSPLLAGARIGNTARVFIEVVPDTFLDQSTILGKVFHDENRNGIQDRGETGVAKAMVVLDDGTYALTDEHGRYHFPAVEAGRRMVKINLHSLPPGTEAATGDSDIVWISPGLTARVNFGVVVPHNVESIGRPREVGVAVAGEAEHHPLEVLGKAEDLSLLVNDRRKCVWRMWIRSSPSPAAVSTTRWSSVSASIPPSPLPDGL